MKELTDQQIIDLYFARSEDAIAETGRRFGGYLTAIAHSILQSREDTEECVNDAYLKDQGQTAGAKSYGLVVDLAVVYYKKSKMIE